MSEKIWSDDAWEDYLYWQTQDKKTVKRINQLIKDIERNGCMEGIGKPEPLTGDLQGEYSRRINDKDRLVYHMENGCIYIGHCRGHYSVSHPFILLFPASLSTTPPITICPQQTRRYPSTRISPHTSPAVCPERAPSSSGPPAPHPNQRRR